MKIASWNVNSLNVRLPHLQQWLAAFAPDVVGIQETKLEDHKFPDAALAALGYRSVFCGQKTYNGVAILSRSPAVDVQMGIPGLDDVQQRVIAATVDGVRIINLYVVNGQDVGTDKYAYKLRWLAAAHDWIAQELQRYPQLVVLGDFNIAPMRATCTMRRCGTSTTSLPRPTSAPRWTSCWRWACTTHSGCTIRTPSTSVGGITARPVFAAIWACVST